MYKRIGQTILFFWIAALAFGCSSHGERSGGGIEPAELEETISAPSSELTQAEKDLVASAEGEHNQALAGFPAETN